MSTTLRTKLYFFSLIYIIIGCAVAKDGDSSYEPTVRDQDSNPYASNNMMEDVPLAGYGGRTAGMIGAGTEDLPLAGEIQAGEIQAGEMQAGEIQAGEMQAGEIQAGEIQAGEMQAGEALAGEVQAGQVVIDDCAGVPNGSASLDNCGECDADPSNDCVQDCSGEWGGDRSLSECGECLLPNEASNCSTIEQITEINGIGGHQSGINAPGTCVDQELTAGETNIDCGGVCGPCGEVSVETLAVRIATYYQAQLFNNFMIKDIYQFNVEDRQITVHYSFAQRSTPNIEAGQDSRIFTLNDQDQVISGGEHMNGVNTAPLSCGDGVQNNQEIMVDCGGTCRPCNELNRANIGVQLKNYYDSNSEWAGTYKLGELVLMNFVENTNYIDVLYGYIDEDQATVIRGYDSRRFSY